MPTVTRTRTVDAPPDDVWRVVSDPDQLPRWWPGVQRVEDVSSDAFTMVLGSSRGKAVRADYTLVEVEPLERLLWRQEIEESPFERILSEALTELRLEEADGDRAQVALTLSTRTRGFARLGALQLRRAARRRLDEALEGLANVFPAREPA